MKDKDRRAVFSHNSDEWETPDDLYNILNYIFNFTLDPCATKENTKCSKFYTKEDDGLSKSWIGERVFVNPPYSGMEAWMNKCRLEHEENKVDVVILAPSRTDRGWLQDHAKSIHYILFIRGRLKFKGGSYGAPFPSCLIFFCPLYPKDIEILESLGILCIPIWKREGEKEEC